MAVISGYHVDDYCVGAFRSAVRALNEHFSAEKVITFADISPGDLVARVPPKILAEGAAKVLKPVPVYLIKQVGTDFDDEGRLVLDDGMLHAIEKKTEYGRQLLHQSWIAYEFRTLQMLRGAGADVPEPYVMAHNAILMGFVGDRQTCAPTLNEVSLDPSEANALLERILNNIDILLSHERIHGDLSAYNILYWKGQISLIDFPQVVSPRENPNAFAIFGRDVRRICEYFSRQGITADAARITQAMWEAHGYRIREARSDI